MTVFTKIEIPYYTYLRASIASSQHKPQTTSLTQKFSPHKGELPGIEPEIHAFAAVESTVLMTWLLLDLV
jgi:hypothetical protein